LRNVATDVDRLGELPSAEGRGLPRGKMLEVVQDRCGHYSKFDALDEQRFESHRQFGVDRSCRFPTGTLTP